MSKPWFNLTRRIGIQRRAPDTGRAGPASTEGPADAIVRLFRGEDVLSTIDSSARAEATEHAGHRPHGLSRSEASK